jgi:5-formyltetrahydrofolate cyclo-ligase
MSRETDAEEKARARARLLLVRRALLPEDVLSRGARIQARLLATPAYRDARTLALYASLPGEVPTDVLLSRALADGKTVAFPAVPEAGKHLTFHAVRGAADLIPRGRLHIREPAATLPLVPLSAIELFVVPGLGFGREGQRLGHGAGYYDATLKEAPKATPLVGLAFQEQVLEALPTEAWDVRMTYVLTEDATFPAPGAAATVVGG